MNNKIVISKKPGKKGEDGHKVFSIRIKEETLSELEAIADKTARSRNEIINIFLEYAIKNYSIDE
ncbi:MAG: ribbon-helix-helix domain-containing protein [Oscillospiraceae bacterium]|jgi:metal-responsive CopG/Arc/MetJ family transcriptional regulator|nr:ribbon-helix-helix domain-containing protein [Oscillospiraceae bacterium]